MSAQSLNITNASPEQIRYWNEMWDAWRRGLGVSYPGLGDNSAVFCEQPFRGLPAG